MMNTLYKFINKLSIVGCNQLTMVCMSPFPLSSVKPEQRRISHRANKTSTHKHVTKVRLASL